MKGLPLSGRFGQMPVSSNSSTAIAFWFRAGSIKPVRSWIRKVTSRSCAADAVNCIRRRRSTTNSAIWSGIRAIGQTTGCGGDLLVRVQAFEAVGGFRPQLIAGEEPELCVRLRENGWKIWRLDTEMTQHDAAMVRLSQFWTRAVRGGHAFAEVSRLHSASQYRIWNHETARAIFWGGLFPLMICLGAIVISRGTLVRACISPSNLSRGNRPKTCLSPVLDICAVP